MSNITKEEILGELTRILVDDLDISQDKIIGTSNLFTDLDLDSIDAVDIAVRMQRFTNKKLTPEEFKQIKTVGDVVNAVWKLLNSDKEA